MNHPKLLQCTKFGWFVSCFSVVLYLACNDIKRYLENEDTTVIAFQKFNASPQDKYPVITLCFHGRYGKFGLIYKENVLNSYGLSVTKYWNVITGKTNATTNEIENLPDFSTVTTSLEELVRSFSTTNRNDRAVNFLSSKKYLNETQFPQTLLPNTSQNSSLVPVIKHSYWPFYLSYQNPNQVCYSQHSEFKYNFIKSSDYISLDTGILNYFHGSGHLDVYLHYAGQTLRSFVKEVTAILLTNHQLNKTIRIQVSGFSVIKRRLDANIACNPNFEDEDIAFRSYVMANISCIPPYWKTLKGSPSGLKPCVSAKQLQDAYQYSQYGNVGNVLDQLHPPCSEMTMISSIDTMNGSHLELKFQYRNDKYWEIRNTRDFGITSLWSGVGGFVGIFLGFSLFQLVEMLMSKIYIYIYIYNIFIRFQFI